MTVLRLIWFCFYWYYAYGEDSFFMLEDANQYYCVTNGSEALYFMRSLRSYSYTEGNIQSYTVPQLSSGNYDFECDFSKRGSCKRSWTKSGWNVVRSTDDTISSVVLDKRWEGFKTYVITSYAINSRIYFEQLSITLEANVVIPFSARAIDQLNLYLCEGSNPPESQCFWFLFQGWRRKKTALRKCDSGFIDSLARDRAPRPPCNVLLSSFEHTEGPLLTDDHWEHFAIEKINNVLTLKMYKDEKYQTILSHTDDESLGNFKYLLASSKDYMAAIKIHEFEYLKTDNYQNYIVSPSITPRDKNAVLISLYLISCSTCQTSIQITNINRDRLYHSSLEKSDQLKGWKHLSFKVVHSGEDIVVTIIPEPPTGNIDSPFWAVDKPKIHAESEYSVLRTQQDSQCYSLQSRKTITLTDATDYSEFYCPEENVITKSCIPLRYFINSQNGIKVCENLKNKITCTCSSGFMGNNCRQPCPYKRYGVSCLKMCSNCFYETCDKIQGECTTYNGQSQCKNKFSGKKCSIPPYGSVLVFPPKVEDNGANYCMIKVVKKQYEGTTPPEWFLIEYRQRFGNNTWNSVGDYPFSHEGNIIVNGLKSSTTYEIKALSYKNKNDIIRDAVIPFSLCQTSCLEWSEDIIQVDTTPTTVTVEVKLTDEHCPLKDYNIQIGSRAQRSFLPNNNKLTAEYLSPFTNYSIIVTKGGKPVANTRFRTKQSAPGIVRDLTTLESHTNKLIISWKKPSVENGIITKYLVKYKLSHKTACARSPINQEEKLVEVISERVILEYLEPYSQYNVTVRAFTVEAGPPLSIRPTTKPSDELHEEEISKEVQIYTKNEHTISVDVSNVECEKIWGPIKLILDYVCYHEWCGSNTEQASTEFPLQNAFDVQGLYAFSTYVVTPKFCRNKSCISVRSINVTTSPSAPKKVRDLLVTSRGKDSISLRWRPPFPPNGILDHYKITIKQSGTFYNQEKTVTISGRPCKLWPMYHCYKANELWKNYETEITVVAINKNPKTEGYPSSVNTVTNPGTPNPPYDLKAYWHNYDVTFEWKHPNETNGRLTSFQYYFYRTGGSTDQFIHIKSEDEYQFIYNITFKDINPSTKLWFSIKCHNEEDSSSLITIAESSPPPKPQIITPLQDINTTETTVSVRFEVGKYNEDKEITIDDSRVFLMIENREDNHVDKLTAPFFKEILGFFPKIILEQKIRKKTDYINFTIGDGSSQYSSYLRETIFNNPLKPGTYNNVIIFLVNSFSDKYSTYWKEYKYSTLGYVEMRKTKPDVEQEKTGGNYALFCLLLLVFLIPITFIVWKKKIKPNLSRIPSPTAISAISQNSRRGTLKEEKNSLIITPVELAHVKPVVAVKPKVMVNKTTNPPNPSTQIYSKVIKISEFEKYVRDSIESGELERQHALFPRGQTQPWNYGMQKTNKPKNRYNNLIAYCHSRVILQKLPGDEYSDYINANYIHGYRTDKAFIATQGPKPATLNDFWRMIWQENVNHIVILANIYEGGKKKVEQYWPNINEELTFGNIKVKYVSTEVSADFEYRSFNASCNGEHRKINQLHFTSWPDHGVPLYSQSLVPFIRKILRISLSSESPIVVHCSAGVGRTGTVILCDIALRMASKEGLMDMLNILQQLREQRPNMVDNVEQYKLAHLVVLECLLGLDTGVPCDDNMESRIAAILSNEIDLQMNYLKDTSWQDQAMKSVAANEEEAPAMYAEKNRFQDVIPEIQGRVFISRYPVNDESSSYINAVLVDGFRNPGRFIATQQPMPNTLGDFWRLVSERNITVIISLNEVDLNNKTCCAFWPTRQEPDMYPVDYLLIQHQNTAILGAYDIVSLKIRNLQPNQQEEEIKTVYILKFKNWTHDQLHPASIENFLSFYEETDVYSRGSENVLVTCLDGAKSCGVYLALTFIIEKIKLEQICDVCQAVKNIRHNRKEFVNNPEQFSFLYKAALLYITGFQSYANFTNPVA